MIYMVTVDSQHSETETRLGIDITSTNLCKDRWHKILQNQSCGSWVMAKMYLYIKIPPKLHKMYLEWSMFTFLSLTRDPQCVI